MRRLDDRELESFARLVMSADGQVLVNVLRQYLADLDKLNRAADASKHSAGRAFALAEILNQLETAPDAVRSKRDARQGNLR